jgi:hypothetical protein
MSVHPGTPDLRPADTAAWDVATQPIEIILAD